MTSKTNLTTTTSVIFFGTGEVSLRTIEGIANHITIEAVITKPDLLGSDGRTSSPAVKQWSEAHGIPCHQPANKSELSELFSNLAHTSPVGLVVDYGLIIPADVINHFELGILNSHFSLLPKWRGADPITWSVLAGDTTTGVSIMQLDVGLDTGDILATKPYHLAPDETTSSLTTQLIAISNQLLIQTLPEYCAGGLTAQPQNDALAAYSKKITKGSGKLMPKQYSATELERQVRAYLGWPGSYFTHKGVLLTIKQAKVSQEPIPTGKLTNHNGRLLLGCKEDSLDILSIQPAGKKPMDAKGFMNGYGRLLD